MQPLPAGGQKWETGTPLNRGCALPYDDRRDDDHGWPHKPARMSISSYESLLIIRTPQPTEEHPMSAKKSFNEIRNEAHTFGISVESRGDKVAFRTPAGKIVAWMYRLGEGSWGGYNGTQAFAGKKGECADWCLDKAVNG